MAGEALMAEGFNHRHHRIGVALAGGALDVGQDLRGVGRIGDPANLGSLHRIPKANAFGVIAPGLRVVGQTLGIGPRTNRLDPYSLESRKGPQTVVSLKGFGGDRRATPHQFVVF